MFVWFLGIIGILRTQRRNNIDERRVVFHASTVTHTVVDKITINIFLYILNFFQAFSDENRFVVKVQVVPFKQLKAVTQLN